MNYFWARLAIFIIGVELDKKQQLWESIMIVNTVQCTDLGSEEGLLDLVRIKERLVWCPVETLEDADPLCDEDYRKVENIFNQLNLLFWGVAQTRANMLSLVAGLETGRRFVVTGEDYTVGVGSGDDLVAHVENIDQLACLPGRSKDLLVDDVRDLINVCGV